MAWPRGANMLRPGGAFNLFYRMQLEPLHPECVENADDLQDGEVSALLLMGRLPSPKSVQVFSRARRGEVALLLSGNAHAIASLIGGEVTSGPWTSGLAVRASNSPWLIAGEGAQVVRDPQEEWVGAQPLGFVHGERTSPKSASLTPIPGAYAVWSSGRAVILNGDPFAMLQRWLQCEVDLLPWLAWNPSLTWLDSYMDRLAGLIVDCFPELISKRRGELGNAHIALRHDVDESTSTRLLEITEHLGVPSTYALLNDKSLPFWLNELRGRTAIEQGFHYNTGRLWSTAAKAICKARKVPVAPIAPAPSQVARGGLAKQINAVRKRGLKPQSLHRHLNFIYYPEIVDAIGCVASDTIRASSSLSRGRVVRYAGDGGGLMGAEAPSPTVQVPTWGPVFFWDAARRQLVDVPESSALMEPEPGLVIQVATTRHSYISTPLVTACFHPAHASSNTIVRGGTHVWLEELIHAARDQGLAFNKFSEGIRTH